MCLTDKHTVLLNESIKNYQTKIENPEIISVEGIDGTIIGPYDMSASFGIPGDLDNSILLAITSK